MPDVLERLVTEIAVRANPDLLLLTGDLLDVPFYAMTGTPQTARRSELAPSILEDYRYIKGVLDRSGLRYIVVPGNHDDEPLMRSVFEQMRVAEQVGDYDLQVFNFDREQDDHYPFRDFSRYEPTISPSRRVIQVQHYVVTPTLNEGYPHTYANAAEILSRNAESAAVVLSVSGHYHRGSKPVTHGSCTYIVAGAICEYPYPLYLYEIDGPNVAIERRTLAAEPRFASLSRPVRLAAAAELQAGTADGHGSWLAVAAPGTGEEACDKLWSGLASRGIDVQGVWAPASAGELRRLEQTAANGFAASP